MANEPNASINLTGGRMTPGVTLVNGAVHRPVTASSEFVAALLQLLHEKGFDGAPRYLGQRDGMDQFSYIPGEVPTRFRTWSDEQITAATILLRNFHDATRGSTLAGRRPIVCHHDPGPNNVVFQNGTPAALIDFDTAAPGSPLEDVGYLAWTWCISSKQTVPVDQQAAQVRTLADAYGLTRAERGVLVDAILERQIRNARFWAEHRTTATTPVVSTTVIDERIAWSRREHAFTHAHRTAFNRALA